LNPALVLVLVLLVGTYVALICPTLRRLCRKCNVEDLSPEWLERFSPQSYYPMERLLNSEDFSFLSRQPGFDLALYRKFRKERLQIFRQYLNRMILDFNRLHLAARLLLAQSAEDRSDLVFKLIMVKVRFSIAVLEAEIRYALCCLGVRTLTARVLILRLEELSNQLAFIAELNSAHAG
jgi:hypothetical protein